uniref:Microcin N immunity protein n=1 Tax=Escherichia coli TaxID=562 RepID=MCNI_ECOLX|nr:RecName: Full=Microcin N immunity protein; AltName: Full=Microcin-24 immunity protein [Escherichia coli]AAA88771.1 microcin 24 immunity protein [Escherichia coli]
MSFLNFAFSPVFFSIMACYFIVWRNKRNEFVCNRLLSIIIISFLICFIYPWLNYKIEVKYYIFEQFYLFCFLSSLVAVVINLIVYFILYRRCI